MYPVTQKVCLKQDETKLNIIGKELMYSCVIFERKLSYIT
jgi:hypothetical protein